MSEFDSPNYAEYSYDVKNEGKIKLGRRLLIVAYILFIGGFFTVCLLTKLIQLFATAPIFLWILIFFTWRYVSFDYYFVFQAGMLELGKSKKTKNGMRKTPRLKIHVKEATRICPYTQELEPKNDTRVYDFSEASSSDKRIIIFFKEEGKDAAAIFEGTEKIAKLLASFCDKSENLKGNAFHG